MRRGLWGEMWQNGNWNISVAVVGRWDEGKTKSKDGGSWSLHELDHEYCIEGDMDC